MTESPIYARILKPSAHPPIKAYVFDYGFNDMFGRIADVNTYLDTLLQMNLVLEDSDYLLAMLWGNNGKRIAEVWAYKLDREDEELVWICNAESTFFVFHGVHPSNEMKMCEDGQKIVAAEIDYRKICSGPEEFLKGLPELGRLEPKEGTHTFFY